MKTYVLLIAKHFPATHTRAGEPTDFASFIKAGIKLHTIRGNYNYWAKRIAEVQAGNAVLSLRQWSGEPYKSKQVEIMQLDKSNGVGVEKISFLNSEYTVVNNSCTPHIYTVSRKDGLIVEDFKEWFKDIISESSTNELTEMALIHFTPFRYAN